MSFFDQFQRSAWRLETQPFYQPDADEFGRYQSGRPPNEAQRHQRQRWLEQVAEVKAAGRTIGRVLLVALPLSPYWRWRLDTAREHVAAGEDIRVAVAGVHAGVGGLDFWLLDDQRLVFLDYDRDGRFLGSTATDDPAALRPARNMRDLAVAASVPLQEFLLPA